MKLLRALFALGLVLASSACARLGFTAVNFPGYFSDVTVVRDVAYGPGPDQKLDIYIPAGAGDQPLDVVVFFYGGRWTFGQKEEYRFIGNAFAKRGFITVIPDYAKYPQVRMPVFVQDGAKALAWVSDNIAAHHGNPARIHVAGHSAGAHIGSLLTADASYLAAEGKDRSKVIHDFTGLAGPYDFVPDEDDLKAMFGPPSAYPKMQATTYINGRQPPILLLHGEADTTVKRSNLDKLVGAIEGRGGCVATRLYPDTDHIGIVAALTWINPDKAPVLDDMVRYFNAPAGRDGCPDWTP